PPRSSLFPYTTLFRSVELARGPLRPAGRLVADVVEQDDSGPPPRQRGDERAEELREVLFAVGVEPERGQELAQRVPDHEAVAREDRKSTRLNSSHVEI